MRGARRIPKGVVAGRGTYFAGPPLLLWNSYGSKLVIGNYTSISKCVTFFLGGQHHTNRITTFQFRIKGGSYSRGDVTIGSDCWIGHGATIMDGVSIGHGVVVGACSVVTKDVPPYMIVAGNPARMIRCRFDPDVVSALLRIAWWDWSVEKILEAVPMMELDDPSSFVAEYDRQENQ